MKISGFLKESFQDWKGLSSVIFVRGCNLNCPGCYANELRGEDDRLYPDKEILNYLGHRKKLISKVVLCGGEPTLQPDLLDFLKELKNIGLEVKLDTNGTNPNVLEKIFDGNLVDYVAMDVKGPRNLYPTIVGIDDFNDFNISTIEKSMKLLSLSKRDYEFRTTIFPIINTENLARWILTEEIKDMVYWIKDNTKSNPNPIHYLQPFTAREKEKMVDPRFSKEELAKEIHETPYALLKEMQESVIGFLLTAE